MKIVYTMLFISALVFPVYAGTEAGRPDADAFTRTIEALGVKDAKSVVHTSKAGIKVTCTFLPQARFIAIAWVIENPHRQVLNITGRDIKLFDQAHELKTLEPAEAADVMFPKTYNRQPRDPILTPDAPSFYLQPALQPRSQAEENIYASSLDLNKTDAARITGMTYYRSEGRGIPRAEIALSGETLAFDFK